MSSANEPPPDENAFASEAVVDDLRKLGLTAAWPAGYRPTYGELLRIDGLDCGRADHAAVDDAVLEVLRYVPNLTQLDLTSTHVTDDGLAALRHVPDLEFLMVNDTHVGDRGLRHLFGHRRLRRFFAHFSRVTIFGERLLHDVLPECRGGIGRAGYRGRVVNRDAAILTVQDRDGELWSVTVPDQKRIELADQFANPIGRIVCFVEGYPPEPNFFTHFAREPKTES